MVTLRAFLFGSIMHLFWSYIHRRNYVTVSNILEIINFLNCFLILHFLTHAQCDLRYTLQWLICVVCIYNKLSVMWSSSFKAIQLMTIFLFFSYISCLIYLYLSRLYSAPPQTYDCIRSTFQYSLVQGLSVFNHTYAVFMCLITHIHMQYMTQCDLPVTCLIIGTSYHTHKMFMCPSICRPIIQLI